MRPDPVSDGSSLTDADIAYGLATVLRAQRCPEPEDHLPGCYCSEACAAYSRWGAEHGLDAEWRHRELVGRGKAMDAREYGTVGTAPCDWGDVVIAALERIADRTEVVEE